MVTREPCIPTKIIDLIKRYDITEHIELGKHVNLFMKDFHYDAGYLHGAVQQHVGISVDSVLDRSMTLKAFTRPVDHIKIQLDENTAKRAMMTELLYVHNMEVEQDDHTSLKMTPYSLLVPSAEDDACTFHPGSWWIEQYAGGMGGWTSAHKFFQPMMKHDLTRISLEMDLQFATQYVLNHKASFVGDVLNMPQDFIMRFSSDIILLTDISDMLWQRQVQWINHHLWTMSAPCQSWSAASYQDGLMSMNGQSLVHSICQAKVFQPKFLGLEQVAGFQSHPQFGFMMNLLEWAGYVKVFGTTCDMADLSPVKRQRWLALFIRNDLKDLCQQPQPWPKTSVVPRHFDALHFNDDSARHAFEPTVDVASRYFLEEYMPKRRSGWTKQEIIAFRVPSLDEVLPTFMKQYGNSHNLKESLLKSHGLFGILLRLDA